MTVLTPRSFPRKLPMTFCLVASSLLLSASTSSAQQDDPAEEPFLTKVYNVASLLDAPVMLNDILGQENDPAPTVIGGFGGGLGGGGGFGGGMGGGLGGGTPAAGGGGIFRIPDNILPQFGGGGGQFGGGGGGVYAPGVSSILDAATLQQMIYDHVSDDDTPWIDMDGDGGKISIVGSILVVTHTAKVHERVAQLLDALKVGNNRAPTVQVDVRIVEVEADKSIEQLTANGKTAAVLANDATAARLSLR